MRDEQERQGWAQEETRLAVDRLKKRPLPREVGPRFPRCPAWGERKHPMVFGLLVPAWASGRLMRNWRRQPKLQQALSTREPPNLQERTRSQGLSPEPAPALRRREPLWRKWQRSFLQRRFCLSCLPLSWPPFPSASYRKDRRRRFQEGC